MTWLALLLACNGHAPEPTSPTMIELPPFEDPAIEPIYDRLASWAEGRGWTERPLRRGGSFLERVWVMGDPGKQPMPLPGAARLELSVCAYANPKSSFGLVWSAGITNPAGQGAHMLVVSGARGITPDQVRIDLKPGADAVVELGSPLTWEVGERTLQTSRPSGLTEVLGKLASYQGAAFAAEATRDLQALEAVVRPVLDRADYTMCDYGPSPGRGIPGDCFPRKPTATELAAHRAAFDAEMARRKAVIGDGVAWRALLDEIVPSPL